MYLGVRSGPCLPQVPWETFNDEDESEDEAAESDDDVEIDEDGNRAPSQPVGP